MDTLTKIRKEDALRYLAKEEIAVLSTHAPDGTIDAAAVYFHTDDELNFYFSTKVGTRKYQHIQAEPRVSLTIPDAKEFKTVEIKGTASTITDIKEVSDHIVALINKNHHEGSPWAPPIAKLEAGQYVIVKVTPDWLRYGTFVNEVPEGDYFTQII